MAALAVMLITSCHSSGSGHDDHDADATHANETDSHEDADEVHLTAAQVKACMLKVESVSAGDFAEVVEVSGRVLPAQGAEATVTATMAGIVGYTNNSMTDGTAVSAGTPLFSINAKAMADGNPAGVAQSEAKAAREAYERAKRLAADKIVSERELEDARQRYEAAMATANSMGSAAQQRNVSAPVSGYMKNILVKPGDYVAAGQPMATVTQNRRLQLRADVPERLYGMLPRIATANFRMAYDDTHSIYSMKELGGRLLSKGKASDSGDFFVPVTFEFDNTGSIVPGSFAEVYLQGAPRHGVLTVPAESVCESQGLYFVYVQTHSGAFRRVDVKTGATDGRRIEIVSGLKAGDKVVTNGVTQVRLAANTGAIPEGHQH